MFGIKNPVNENISNSDSTKIYDENINNDKRSNSNKNENFNDKENGHNKNQIQIFSNDKNFDKIESKNANQNENSNNYINRKNEVKRKKIVPYEIKLEKYLKRREEIFTDFPSKRYKNILKTRDRYHERKKERKEIATSILSSFTDIRPYLDVSLNKVNLKGLMDSGANVSCLGKNCFENLAKMKTKIYDFRSKIKTAGGGKQNIIGKVLLEVECNNRKELVRFFLVPSLTQELILGYDFWKKFDIKISIGNYIINEISLDTPDPQVHQLNMEQQIKLENAKLEFKCYTQHGLGKTHLETHIIDTENAEPRKMRYYPVSPAIQKLTYAELDRMLELDVIEIATQAEWNNRTTLVMKPGKNRLCLDARELNKVTKKDAYPLPNIDGLLSRLGDTHFISAIDLKDAFWQIPLEESSRQKTAFTVQGRPHYQFKVMPFGLCNAAQRLCRLMDKVVPPELKNKVFVYLDDLLIVSPNFEEHLEMLKTIGKSLTKAGLTINMQKSKFCPKELKYLGYIVGGGKLKTDPSKVEAITKITPPKNVKDVRKFLGTVGWYRRFIPDFSTLTAPLTDTLKKCTKFNLTPDANKAFEELKLRLVSSPVLSSPDFQKPFFVQCDASNVGIGAVLFQKDEVGEHPIEYFSRKLNTAQKNYSTTEKECLAVVLAIEKFRQYIEMMEFTVITDHSSLKWLMQQKDLNGRLARWSLKLQGFKFDIQHRKGSKNIVPDMLSRLDMEEIEMVINEIIDFNSIEFQSPEYMKLIDTIQQNKSSLPDLKITDGYVYKKTKFNRGDEEEEDECWKIWLPEKLTENVIKKAHEDNTCHGGVTKTLFNVREFFYWPTMSKQVREYIKRCDLCKECKHPKQTLRPPMGNEVITHRPFQKIYIDFLGPYPRTRTGNTHIFIVLDHATKFVLLKSMTKATSKAVIKFLTSEVFHKFGVPEIVHSDNGKQFTSDAFKELMNLFGIHHMKTAIHSPQSNASERVNQSILSSIRTFLTSDQTKWDENLSNIECALRTTVHASTGVTPYFALFGYNMVTHAQAYQIMRKLGNIEDGETQVLPKSSKMQLIREKIKDKLHQSYEKNVKTYNKRCKTTNFKPGQEVYRKNFTQSDFSKAINAKLCKQWIKCRIRKAVGKNLYEVENLKGQLIGTIHGQHLKH